MLTIRYVETDDRPGWEQLYRGYADFYNVDTDDRKLSTLFGWLFDPAHVCEGLVAEAASGELVGLAHFRAMPSPLRGAEIGFLDDLFVAPDQRGTGAAEALLRAVDTAAEARGWDVVRWITRDTNYRARGIYDRLSTRSDWVTYEMTALSVGRDAS